MAQDTTLPAGNYRLTYDHAAHTLWIRGLDRNSGDAFVSVISASPSNSSADPRLGFNCYSNTCYLATISQGNLYGGGGLKVPEAEHQRKLAFTQRVVSLTIPAR
jgi:hypothetical protein